MGTMFEFPEAPTLRYGGLLALRDDGQGYFEVGRIALPPSDRVPRTIDVSVLVVTRGGVSELTTVGRVSTLTVQTPPPPSRRSLHFSIVEGAANFDPCGREVFTYQSQDTLPADIAVNHDETAIYFDQRHARDWVSAAPKTRLTAQ